MTFREDVGAGGLLGLIGGLLGRRSREGASGHTPQILDVRPVLSGTGHEIASMRVRTTEGLYDVTVKVVDG